MSVYKDTDALLKAYSSTTNSNCSISSNPNKVALKILNVSRRGVPSKEERQNRLREEEQ
jgi:hypothetical protein